MKALLTSLIFMLLCTVSMAQDDINCKPYKTGYFEFEGKHTNVVIYRTKDYQIEYNIENNEWVTIQINWKSDCTYSFTYINTNMKRLSEYIGHSLDVDIVEGNSEGYTYHSVYKGGKGEFHGKIIFLVTDVSKAKKKKIKQKLRETKK